MVSAVVLAAYGPYAAGPYGLGLARVSSLPRPDGSPAGVLQRFDAAAGGLEYRLVPVGPDPAVGPPAAPPSQLRVPAGAGVLLPDPDAFGRGARVESAVVDWDADGLADSTLERIPGGWERVVLDPPGGPGAIALARYRTPSDVTAGNAAVTRTPARHGRAVWRFHRPDGLVGRIEYVAHGRVVERVFLDSAGRVSCRQIPAGVPPVPSSWPESLTRNPAAWVRVDGGAARAC